MQCLLDEVKKLSIHDPTFCDITRKDRVEKRRIYTEITIHLSGPIKRRKRPVKPITIDSALPRSRNLDLIDDVSSPTPEWLTMTDLERREYLDQEMDDYWNGMLCEHRPPTRICPVHSSHCNTIEVYDSPAKAVIQDLKKGNVKSIDVICTGNIKNCKNECEWNGVCTLNYISHTDTRVTAYDSTYACYTIDICSIVSYTPKH